MVQYRRAWVAGGSFFFTVTLADRCARFLTDHIDSLRQGFRVVQARHPFTVGAIVVLPEHLHALWTLPADDHDYAVRWQGIKRHFTQRLREMKVPIARHANGEPALWQRRYWEHCIRSQDDWQRHMDYIHFNPVKHGYVDRVMDWPYSSFHREVRCGRLALDWGGAPDERGTRFGE